MTEKKFKKIVREHPYLVNPAFIMTRSEAEEIYKRGFPTPEEIIAGAKEKSNLPTYVWEEFNNVLEIKNRKSKQAVQQVKSIEKFGIIFSRKKVAILLAVFILLTSFFTLTPVGRAMARDIYMYVINFFGNKLEVSYNSESNSTPSGLDFLPSEETRSIQYSSHDEFYAENDLEPLKFNWLSATEIVFETNIHGVKILNSSYQSDAGIPAYVRQEWEISVDIEKYYYAKKDSVKTSIQSKPP